jgi:hypothetical protein
VRAAAGCARCDEAGTTVVVEFSAVTTYLELCEEHLADLLLGARPAEVAIPAAHLLGVAGVQEKGAPSC